jgi:hypothetical protein
MRVRTLYLVCTLLCLQVGALGAMPQAGADPVSGTWTGDWGPSPDDRNPVTVELKLDGTKVTGTINPGPNAVPVQKGTYDPKTGEVHIEADAKDRNGNAVHYVVHGKAEKGTMSGSWSHAKSKGDFKVTKQA